MNPLIAAAMAACLRNMSGGAYDQDFRDCEKITVQYNMEVESLAAAPAAISAVEGEHSRQADLGIVKGAAATLP
jgi:hypothetical protein